MSRPHPAALAEPDFQRIGERGATDPRNSYAHSMEWFRGKLYIGTFRDNLCLMKRTTREIPPPRMEFWPVDCPSPEVPELLRGQIVCFDPETRAWSVAYQAPMVDTDNGPIHREVGYRGMVAHRGPSDPEPCLYAASLSTFGSKVLRSANGSDWELTATMPGPSLRTLVSFRARLYTAIVGQLERHGNESSYREVWESEDPAAGAWRPVSAPGFGDDGNTSVFELCAWDDHLYVSTMNPVSGFQIWKSDLEGKPPYRWRKVLSAGAYRGFLNQMGLSMCVFEGALYVGTGIAGGGYDRVRKIGPAAAELIRIHPDDSWELVVGVPRLTPAGPRLPTSGFGPGFDNFLNGYLWKLCVHDGHLYAGTFNSAAFAPFRPHALDSRPEPAKEVIERLLPTGKIEGFLERFGGAHLWRSRDGDRFEPVTRDGFGTVYNMGVRQMVSTPIGLFVGTANSFGPRVAVKEPDGWRYVDNPRGGMEVFLGRARDDEPRDRPAPRRTAGRRSFHQALRALETELELRLDALFLDDLYERSGFAHVGLWDAGVERPRAACERLIDHLAGRLTPGDGLLLEVGCGRGATTERLARTWPASRILAVDESAWAIDWARHRVAGPRFEVMDLTALALETGSVAQVVSVESPARAESRWRFYREAARVLAPGGRLVAADLVWSKDAVVASRGRHRSAYEKDLERYRHRLVAAGFEPALTLEDATPRSVPCFVANASAWLREQLGAGEIGAGVFTGAMARVSLRALAIQRYVLVDAVVAPRRRQV